ncbi:hypothetical protein [Streptomyces axinellae]|uniref:hypothetical protein n=1 Tax=Streptomyces axinellae TaxID=552788 RepID=UPI0031D54C81
MKWVGGMCEATTALKGVRKDSAKDLKEIRHPDKEAGESADFLAISYISATSAEVDAAELDLEQLGRSGVPAADGLLVAWRKKLKSVGPELDDISPGDALDDAEGTAGKFDRLIQTLTPPEPDLPALAKKDPQLAAARERAKKS